MIDDVELDDIEDAILKTNLAIKKKPDIVELHQLRRNLEGMKVALAQMKKLRDDFDRGNIITEQYWVQDKKLKTDFERCRNEALVLDIIQKLPEEEKSRLTRIKEAVVSNKDFIFLVVQVAQTIISVASGLGKSSN
jgi:Tfp pilus assembly protein PilO